MVRIIGIRMRASLFQKPQLSSSAASITSAGSECRAARQTTMWKPTHFQASTRITAQSAVFGLPSQTSVQPPRPSARRRRFATPQS